MSSDDRRLILAGDIGGTKTYMGLFRLDGAELEAVRYRKAANADHDGVESIIEDFLEEGEAEKVASSAVGIACPVVGNRCKLTNLDWVVDGEEIRKAFGFKGFTLLNDLVATAWGVGVLSGDDLRVLQAGSEQTGNRALVAAGTGLGEAHLFWDGERHRPSPSEGGHGDFAPRNEEEVALLGFLSKRFGHVSYERILSGPGLANLYEFVASRAGSPLAADEGLDPSTIAGSAADGSDELAGEALRIFISIYGAEAGNMALRDLAVSGLYVGGGIAPKIIEAMEKGPFMESFLDKGRFRGFLEEVPVRVIMNERAALYGAASAAVVDATEGEHGATRVVESGVAV